MIRFLRRRRENRMPATPIAELREDVRARITGRAVAIGTLTAPCTSRSCIAFKVNLIVEGRTIEVSEVAGFAIDDGTGRALIDAGNAPSLDLVVDVSKTVPASKVHDIPIVRQLRLRALSDHLGVMIYDEGILAAGAVVSVWGVATREVVAVPGLAPAGYRDAGNTIMRLAASRDAPIRITAQR